MPNEQIIEFALRGAWVSCPYMYSYNWLIHDKTKISKENLRVEYYLQEAVHQCTILPPTGAKSLTKFNPKMQDFKRDMDLNCK